MIYVRGVASNIKGGVEAELAERTLIVGPNESGKSAIVNAVELALTGRASDITGRATMAAESELLALAPNRRESMAATVKLSDGTDSDWILEVAGKKTKKAKLNVPKCVDPERVFPLRAVRDELTGSVARARTFFFRQVGEVDAKAYLDRIPPELEPLWREAVSACPAVLGAGDRLLAGLAETKRKARAATAEAKGAVAVQDAVGQGLPPEVTPDGMLKLREGVLTAQRHLEETIKARAQGLEAADTARRLQAAREGLATRRAALEARIAEWRGKHAAANAALTAAKEAAAVLPPPPEESPTKVALRSAAQVLVGHHAEQKSNTCLVCGCAIDPQASIARHLHLSQALEARRAAEAARAWAVRVVGEAQAKVAALESDARVLLESRGQLNTQEADLAAAQPVLGEIPTEEVLAERREALAAAQARIADAEAVNASWATARQARAASQTATRGGAEWGRLQKILEKAIDDLLDTRVANFVARVNEHLPKSDTFHLSLREGEAEVCRFGLMRDGVLHTALSGAAWARTCAAIALATAPADGKLQIVIPEDRAFDPVTLTRAMEGFARAPMQVIMTSPIMPASIPAGWAVLALK